MNIKEHIEAGHYPKDDKGRALVPMRDGCTAVIAATDFGSTIFPIIGWPSDGGSTMAVLQSWQAGGRNNLGGEGRRDLLPPSPRKVKVTGYARVITGTRCFVNVYEKRLEAAQDLGPRETLVELTGEYDQGWE